MGHSETVTMRAAELTEFRSDVLTGAQIYLRTESAPLGELVRVLASHLECDQLPVRTMLLALTSSGELRLQGVQVSLPAGSAPRVTEDQR